MPARILVAGIGNIFLGDDAFGSEVARRLLQQPLPDAVHVVDFGIRGLDLTYALLEDYEAAILVDATQRGEAPGTLYVIDAQQGETEDVAGGSPLVEPHGMDPVKVLRLASAMGGTVKQTLVLGCEPETFGTDDDPAMGLSPSVEAAVHRALPLLESLIGALLAQTEPGVTGPLAEP